MMYMTRTVVGPVFLSGLFFFSTASHAEQPYQVELSGGYEEQDADSSTDKSAIISAEVFFSPVKTDNRPLAEAAFLAKSSSVFLGYVKQKSDLKNSNVNRIDFKGPAAGINYITETHAIILSAAYFKQDIDTDNNLITGDTTVASFSIGKYLDDNSAVTFSYSTLDSQLRNTMTNQRFSDDAKQYGLSYKTIQPLGNSRYFGLQADIELIKSDSASIKEDNRDFSIQGQYYFSRMTSLGVEAALNSGDDISQEGKRIAVELTQFFLPQFALNLSWSKFFADDSLIENNNVISVNAIARF